MLDLAPEIENTVRDYAAREGVTIDELMARAFPPRPQPETSEETLEQAKQRVFALLAKWQKEAGLPQPVGGSKTLAELRAEWAIEDANMTEEERTAEEAFWVAHNEALRNSPGVSI